MIGIDFSYSGHFLSDFGMKMFDVSDSQIDPQKFVSREIDRSDITSVRTIPNHYSVYYSNTLILSFLIMKDNIVCNNNPNMRITKHELNNLMAWLEGSKKPEQLLVINSDNEEDTYYFGVFTDIQPYVFNYQCYGLYLTFTCNAPYGFSDLYTNIYKIDSIIGDFNCTFNNTSFEYKDFLKPVIKIYSNDTFSGTEKISFTNNSDSGKTMTIILPSGKSSLIIDNEKKQIVDNLGNLISLSELGLTLPESNEYNFVSADTYLFYWFRLAPGKNNIKISTLTQNNISKIEISVRFIMKSGGF